jgi:hypothetical protein|nr:MAG TPA: tail assembly chaperone protein [Caudoviricetes sp.]
MADDFKAFMSAPAIQSEDISYVASKRFKDSKGEPVPWKFKLISMDENEAIVASCTHKFIGPTGKQETSTNFADYQAHLCTACVTYPNLNDAALQGHFGAVGAEDLLKKMLLPGEYTDLFKAISQALGFENDMNDKIKKAKN